MTISTAEMQARIRREVAMPSRLGHTALLTVSTIVGGTVASLLVTEPSLPPRTQWAFILIVLIAVSWMGYAALVLARRQVLFGTQRIAAAGLACVFTAIAFTGAVLLEEHVGAGAVVTTGALMIAAGVVMWRASRHVRRLQALARALDAHEVSR